MIAFKVISDEWVDAMLSKKYNCTVYQIFYRIFFLLDNYGTTCANENEPNFATPFRLLAYEWEVAKGGATIDIPVD